MINNNKRGQAAMEFLMTYGWAILAAIVVIAVLAIYFRPQNVIGQPSTMSAPFNVLSQQISAGSDDASVELRNNGAEVLKIAALADIVVTVNSPTGGACESVSLTEDSAGSTAVTFPNYLWGPGTTLYLHCLNDGTPLSLDEGKTFDADITITYTSGDGSYSKKSAGSLIGKVAA